MGAALVREMNPKVNAEKLEDYLRRVRGDIQEIYIEKVADLVETDFTRIPALHPQVSKWNPDKEGPQKENSTVQRGLTKGKSGVRTQKTIVTGERGNKLKGGRPAPKKKTNSKGEGSQDSKFGRDAKNVKGERSCDTEQRSIGRGGEYLE
eukprot:GHVU01213967.1.p2 GENE.GHVU01213967.1~~GHVU01213967.1.p2  ORF type:complete len:150 (-),score=28.75 GHVU01213967.1:127-576(-)